MNKDLSDGELAIKSLNGDSEAFAILVARYQDVAYAAAYSVVRNFQDARDIAQEAWIKVYQKLAIYDPDRHFGAWLYSISKRCAIDWLRDNQSVPIDGLSVVENITISDSPDKDQEKREIYEIVYSAMSSLSEVNRETTVLYYINGYTQNDISKILRVPLGTVKRRLYDSRKKLKKEVINNERDI